MKLFHSFSLLWASLRAYPRYYLQVTTKDATLHELRRSELAYTVTKTHSTKTNTFAALSTFLDRVIPVKERRPFSVVICIKGTSPGSDPGLRKTGPRIKSGEASLIALLHRLGLSPYGITDTPLFSEKKESIARAENTTPRDTLIPKLFYATGGVLLTSFLLCSSLVAWSVWQQAKQQQFVLTQRDKLRLQTALPAPPKIIEREAVAAALEKLNVILAKSRIHRSLTSRDDTNATTLHSATIKDGTLQATLRSHNKEILEKSRFRTSRNDRQDSTPKQIPGCHPLLWQTKVTVPSLSATK